MAFCDNCGAPIAPGNKFCEKCGTPVDDPLLPSPQQPPNRQETPPPATYHESPVPATLPASQSIPPIYIVVGISVVVIIIAAVLASGVMPGSSKRTIAPEPDPIIGVWRHYDSGYDFRERISADGTFVQSLVRPDETQPSVTYGTWSAQGGNSYTMHYSDGGSFTMIFVPSQNYIYDTNYLDQLYYPYKGDVMTDSTTSHIPSETITGQVTTGGTFTTVTHIRDPTTSQYSIKLVGPKNTDFDLYVKKGSAPTKSDYDYRSFKTGSDEQIDIHNPNVGDYYILVNSASGSGAVTLYINYQY